MPHIFIYAGFISLHLALVAMRMPHLHRYGPSSLLFLGLFEVFFALPLYLDVLFGSPQYFAFPGLAAARDSELAQVGYVIAVLACDLALSLGLIIRKPVSPAPTVLGKRFLWLLLLAAYVPIIYVLATGSQSILLSYGEAALNTAAYDADFVGTLTTLIAVSFLAVGLVFITSRFAGPVRSGWRDLLLFGPAAMLNIWLMGKRSIIAFTLLVIGMRLLAGRGKRSTARALVIASGGMIFALTVSQIYQTTFRPQAQSDAATAYETFRIDMGRDHDLKLALSREFDDTLVPILEYRGQSLLFIATFPVPRSVWRQKPLPYAVYATAAALNIPRRELGWGLTTSLFAEAVANLGLVGLPLVLMLFIWALRRIDQSRDMLLRFFGTLSLCSLLAVQFAALSMWHVAFVGYALWLLLRRIHARWRRSPAQEGPSAIAAGLTG